MASILKRPRSKFWFAAFTDANGRRLKKSTKTTDRKMALKIANELEGVANKRRTLLQVRRVIGSLSRDLLGLDMRELTMREHVESWLATKAPTNAPSTAVFYRNSTSKFLTWLGERADLEISFVTKADILAFRNERIKCAAPKTVNHEIKVLRMVFRAARKDELIEDNPAEFVATVKDKKEESARRPFTVPELRAVLGACDDEWKSSSTTGASACCPCVHVEVGISTRHSQKDQQDHLLGRDPEPARWVQRIQCASRIRDRLCSFDYCGETKPH